MSLVITVNFNATARTNSILRAYEIDNTGAVVQDVSAPTGASTASPTVTLTTTPAATSILVVGILVRGSTTTPDVSSVTDPTNGAWTNEVNQPGTHITAAIFAHLPAGCSVVGTSSAAGTAGAVTSGATGVTGQTATLIGLMGCVTTGRTWSALPGTPWVNDATVSSTVAGGAMEEQSGHYPNAPSGAYTYSGTLSSGENNVGAIAAFAFPAAVTFVPRPILYLRPPRQRQVDPTMARVITFAPAVGPPIGAAIPSEITTVLSSWSN